MAAEMSPMDALSNPFSPKMRAAVSKIWAWPAARATSVLRVNGRTDAGRDYTYGPVGRLAPAPPACQEPGGDPPDVSRTTLGNLAPLTGVSLRPPRDAGSVHRLHAPETLHRLRRPC